MKTLPGAHDEGIKDNPPVHSKFDKSRGKGLPAPHLSHPGATAKVTGSSHAGHTVNGNRLPTERGTSHGGHTTHHHEPGKLGTMMAEGHRNIYGMPNANHTDRVSPGKVVSPESRMHLHEPDPVHAGGDKHSKQHNTAGGNRYEGGGKTPKSSSPQRMEDSSKRSKAPHGQLDRVKMKGRS